MTALPIGGRVDWACLPFSRIVTGREGPVRASRGRKQATHEPHRAGGVGCRYQLTLTTYERAKTHYGSMKGFNFQLKQPLDEKRFEMLWKRLNQDKGFQLLVDSAR